MNFTKAEIEHIVKLCDVVINGRQGPNNPDKERVGGYEGNADLSLQRFAIRHLNDLIYPHYTMYVKETNDMLFKYIETDKGKPKFKSALIDLNSKEAPKQKEFIWKSVNAQEDYVKELDNYLKQPVEVNEYKTYPIEKLLETKVKVGNTEVYLLLKYLME